MELLTSHARWGTGLIRALRGTGPAGEHAGKVMRFGRFVGSWHLDWTGHDASGQPATMSGELHFGWVLGGCAVHDIWIGPGRGQPGEGQPPRAGAQIGGYRSRCSTTQLRVRRLVQEAVNHRDLDVPGNGANGEIVLAPHALDRAILRFLPRLQNGDHRRR